MVLVVESRPSPLLPARGSKEWCLFSSTPQLPFKTPQIPFNRDHKALNSGTLGGVGSSLSMWGRLTLGAQIDGMQHFTAPGAYTVLSPLQAAESGRGAGGFQRR